MNDNVLFICIYHKQFDGELVIDRKLDGMTTCISLGTCIEVVSRQNFYYSFVAIVFMYFVESKRDVVTSLFFLLCVAN